MALPAIRIDKLVVAVGVTLLAKRKDVRTLERKLRRRMIERGRLPSNG